MGELSFKCHNLSSHAGQQIQTWLEMQEKTADGASKDVCVSNVLTYVFKKPCALNPKKWVAFPLESRIDINHNTRRLRFKLPVEELGLPVGMHIFLKGSVDGKPVMRAYTPVGHGGPPRPPSAPPPPPPLPPPPRAVLRRVCHQGLFPAAAQVP